MDNEEIETFVKIVGQKFAYKVINYEENGQWVSFDRVNTKTGEIAGHFRLPLTQVESIETR